MDVEVKFGWSAGWFQGGISKVVGWVFRRITRGFKRKIPQSVVVKKRHPLHIVVLKHNAGQLKNQKKAQKPSIFDDGVGRGAFVRGERGQGRMAQRVEEGDPVAWSA